MTTATDPRYTQAGYHLARQSWQDLIEMFGLNDYRLKRMQAAYALWVAGGPDFADDDDWLDAAQEWHRTYLANQAAA